MTKFSMKYKKEYMKAKRMLGKKGIKGSYIILGLVGIAIVYFVIKKKGGGGAPPIGDMVGSGMYVPGGTTALPVQDVFGLGQVGTEYLAAKPPLDLYDIYSGAVGDVQYVPSTADIVAYRRQSEQPYEMGITYQPY